MADPDTTSPSDDWESHWDNFADSAHNNPAQAFRRSRILHCLGQLGPSTRLVDIGCGQGDLLADLAREYPQAQLLGVEQSSSGLRHARIKVPEAQFVQRDLIAPEQPQTEAAHWATHATCSEVLEHVEEPVTLLKNAMCFLAPNAKLVVTVPGGPMSAYDKHIGHRTHYTTDALSRILLEAGFTDVDVRRTGFPTFNLYKLMVIARGDRLIEDSKPSERPSRIARVAAAVPIRAPRLAIRLADRRNCPLPWVESLFWLASARGRPTRIAARGRATWRSAHRSSWSSSSTCSRR